MKKRGSLFELNEDLHVYNKTVRIRKEKTDKGLTKSTSVNYYDDQQPIALTGPGNISYHMSLDWAVESFESSPVQDVDYVEVKNEPSEFSGNERALSFEAEVVETLESTTGDHENNYTISDNNEVKQDIQPLQEEVRGLSDDTLATDLAEILGGKKVFDPETKKLVEKNEVKDDFIDKIRLADQQRTNNEVDPKIAEEQKKEDQHAIFEKIAQNMNYANSFDLGEFELEKRFESFDQEEESKTSLPGLPAMPSPPPLPEFPSIPIPPNPLEAIKSSLPFSTEDFVKDLDLIRSGSEAFTETVRDKNWPPEPAGLIQPSTARTKQMFGTFEFEAIEGSSNCEVNIKGNWVANNITTVDIPQLIGKINGTTNKEIKKGSIMFNKKAVNQLTNLWKEWESAGLLDRIITYDGGFVPRFKKIKGGGCATSLSNHAWGTAFDINAKWNALGTEPALIGKTGCTRELVEIANKHGFYWGGHFDTKDGMHFEVAEII